MRFYVTSLDLNGKLQALRRETGALTLRNYELGNRIDAMLAQIDREPNRAELRAAGRVYLSTVSNAELREDLILARGAVSAAHLRTRLNGDLEQRRGRRHPAAGTPRVPTNGDSAHAV
jgi:hypothetical protein